MNLTLAVDCGTTNLKAGVVTQSGNVLSYSTSPIELHAPEPDAAVHHSEALWSGFVSTINDVTAEYKQDIDVLGLSGYQFGFIPLDADYTPLMDMITLLDGRSRGALSSLTDKVEVETIYRKTGLPPMFTSLLAKIAWLRASKPGIYEQAAYYADIKSFLIHRLTGELVTEPSIAATTQMLDFAAMDWDEDLLDAVGVTTCQMPRVVSGDRIMGEISPPVAETLGLKSDTKLLPGLYDGGALLVGMGALAGNEAVCSIGTSTMLRTCVNQPVLDDPSMRRLQTYPLFEDTWATGGGINNGGVVLQWCKDRLLEADGYDEVLTEAQSVSAGAEGLICLPYLSGERDPRISENASGMFLGIRPQHGPEHFTRAILEGVACTVNLVKEAITIHDIQLDEIRICGSGSQSDLWCQIFADICDSPVNRSVEEDTTLIGTSMIAGAATGVFKDLQEATQQVVQSGDGFDPNEDNRKTYDNLFACYQSLLPNALKMYDSQNTYWSAVQSRKQSTPTE